MSTPSTFFHSTSPPGVNDDLLSAGIAIYDEYPDMYNYVATMIFRDYVPPRNFIYSGHNYHQGTGYVSVRYVNDLISLFIFDRMGAGPIYDPSQQFVLYDFIYRRRPDGHVMPAGDVNPGNRKSPNSYAMPAMFAAERVFHQAVGRASSAYDAAVVDGLRPGAEDSGGPSAHKVQRDTFRLDDSEDRLGRQCRDSGDEGEREFLR